MEVAVEAVVLEPGAAGAEMASGEVQVNLAMEVGWVGLDSAVAAMEAVVEGRVAGSLAAREASTVAVVRCASGLA